MRSLIGIVAVLAVGYVLYTGQAGGLGTRGGTPPQQHVDVTGIRASLLAIGQAQRLYVNAHGTYATLDQLRQDGAPHVGADQRGYTFSVEPNGAAGFRATATPHDPERAGWPTLTIDETMHVSER